MSEEEKAVYQSMRSALNRRMVVPKFIYLGYNEDHPCEEMRVDDVEVPFAGFISEMQKNAVNVRNLLDSMLDNLFENMRSSVDQSHTETSQFHNVMEIFDNMDLSVTEALPLLSEHEGELQSYTAQLEALKKIAELSMDAHELSSGFFYSNSVNFDALENTELNTLFVNLQKDLTSLSEIVETIPHALDVDTSIKDTYLSTIDPTNTTALSTLGTNIRDIAKDIDALCVQTTNKLDDYYWDVGKKFINYRNRTNNPDLQGGYGGIG